jgi:hypothetical protein
MSNPIEFTHIPEWTYTDVSPSVLTFFEVIALSGLEGEWIRLSADTQRKLLGHNVFGKRSIRIKDGLVECIIKIAFGNDFEHTTYEQSHVRRAVELGKQLRPGYTGKNYA